MRIEHNVLESHLAFERPGERPACDTRVSYRREPASAVTLKLHDGSTLFAAHQNPTLSLLVLGGFIAVSHPVTGRPWFRITSTVGAFFLKLLVPPCKPKSRVGTGGWMIQPRDGKR